MNKTARVLLFSLIFAVLLSGYALADVATGPLYATLIGIPLLIIAVSVIIIVVIVKVAGRNKSAKPKDPDEPENKP
jgi:hypothetical protein